MQMYFSNEEFLYTDSYFCLKEYFYTEWLMVGTWLYQWITLNLNFLHFPTKKHKAIKTVMGFIFNIIITLSLTLFGD